MARQETNYIVIHCAATKPNSKWKGAEDIRRDHRMRGWLDIGYHFVIRRDGEVELGRAVDAVGAHVKGHNRESLGICLMGGLNTKGAPADNFTTEQYAALDKLLKELREKYPDAQIVGHNDLNPRKACPCFDVHDWLDADLI